jgi:hypothetical protein
MEEEVKKEKGHLCGIDAVGKSNPVTFPRRLKNQKSSVFIL